LHKEIEPNLIELARAGDGHAFGEIYFRLKDSIYRFAFRMTNESSVAEEITQEVFMFFIENPDKFDPERGTTLFPFLCGVARNKILNHLKKSGTRLEENNYESNEFENFAGGNGGSPLKNLLEKEFAARLEESVARLSPLQREALLLREMEELTYEEIAAVTATDIGVVKSRLYRARRTLARELAPYLKNEKEENVYEMHGS
jgi:RNA polymerase sigma-70 factor, ECF subfamily